MAIINNQKSLRDYRNYYHRQLIGLLIGALILTITGTGLALHFTGAAPIDSLDFWIIIGATIMIGCISLAIASRFITRPIRDIIAALAYKSDELTDRTPPNPNSRHNEKTGFKTVLQTIYDIKTETPNNQITEEKQSISFLTQALNQTSCGIVILNNKRQIIFANATAPIAQSLEGKKYLALDFLNEQTIDDWLDEIADGSVRAEKRWSRIGTNIDVIKNTKYYDVVASHETAAVGETVIMLIDRSEQYVPEEEDLNFIAFAAHELRGPITVIRGYLDILSGELADRLQGDESQLMDRLTVSSNRLSGYIDNILNVAKFDRHHLRVHLLEDSVVNIYSSIADDMQLRASTQHRMLNVSFPDNLPTVAADSGSINEVISNLIDNAIKYSFEGGVISVTAEQKGDFVEISVADNGIGMPPNVVNNLFHKFYRSHRSREAVAGTGIGLYICKAFVESHGGVITARSKENEGSVFSFTLPIYATVKDKLLEDGQLNNGLIRQGGGWIKNHNMYRG